jgi:hypothetical protein
MFMNMSRVSRDIELKIELTEYFDSNLSYNSVLVANYEHFYTTPADALVSPIECQLILPT